MLNTNCIIEEGPKRYPTVSDFIEIYNEEMNSLFLLAILLTADVVKAEQCFISGLEESLQKMDVFSEWARLWARRAIIEHAIQEVMPVQRFKQNSPLLSLPWPEAPRTNSLLSALFALDSFQRFVFVMSLIERQTDEECAYLLSCRLQDIKTARSLALQNLSYADSGGDADEEALHAWRTIWLQQNLRTSA